MNSLQQISAFSDTARHGSFAAAARETGQAPSTLAKSVARLEERLGVRLFHRTTRQVSLTADGERLFQRCQRLLAEVEELQADAAGVRAGPGGVLRIDMPIVLGRRTVLPLLAQLAAAHPALSFDLRLQDGYADLVKEGIDMAIRIGRLSDSTLVSRRFGSQEMVLVASPSYLERRGTPRRLEQLAGHDALVFRLPSTGKDRPWEFRQKGRTVDMRPASRVRISDGEGLVQAVLLHQGIAQLPDYFVQDELAAGTVVELLPALRPPPIPVSIVYPAARLLPPRVRVVVDALLALRR